MSSSGEVGHSEGANQRAEAALLTYSAFQLVAHLIKLAGGAIFVDVGVKIPFRLNMMLQRILFYN